MLAQALLLTLYNIFQKSSPILNLFMNSSDHLINISNKDRYSGSYLRMFFSTHPPGWLGTNMTSPSSSPWTAGSALVVVSSHCWMEQTCAHTELAHYRAQTLACALCHPCQMLPLSKGEGNENTNNHVKSKIKKGRTLCVVIWLILGWTHFVPPRWGRQVFLKSYILWK